MRSNDTQYKDFFEQLNLLTNLRIGYDADSTEMVLSSLLKAIANRTPDEIEKTLVELALNGRSPTETGWAEKKEAVIKSGAHTVGSIVIQKTQLEIVEQFESGSHHVSFPLKSFASMLNWEDPETEIQLFCEDQPFTAEIRDNTIIFLSEVKSELEPPVPILKKIPEQTS